jgi:hypothetical protein
LEINEEFMRSALADAETQPTQGVLTRAGIVSELV